MTSRAQTIRPFKPSYNGLNYIILILSGSLSAQNSRPNLASTSNTGEVQVSSDYSRCTALSVRAGEVFANTAKALNWRQTPNRPCTARRRSRRPTPKRASRRLTKVLTRIEHGVLGSAEVPNDVAVESWKIGPCPAMSRFIERSIAFF